jgi:L-ascorbate metabolism protein UlaG (beta-lactamase superfamily)
MIEGIEWLGHDSFRVTGSKTVYIDPWKLVPGQPQADVILITHDHYDHFNKDDIVALSGPSTVVVGLPGVTSKLPGNTVSVQPGDTVTANGVTVTAVQAYNVNKFRAPGEVYHPKGSGVGYIFEFDGRRIYHAGDTDSIPEMAGIEVNVALLPVGGTFTMTAGEAAEACHVIKADVVIPMHWGDIVGSRADAERLSRICRYRVEILEPTQA